MQDEPSWTGRGTMPAPHRLAQWLSGADTKHILNGGPDLAFTENINWRIFRIMAEFVEGFEFLSGLRKTVSVFGSSVAQPSDPYYQISKEIGRLCAEAGLTMVTGGGPGMMEAANCGAAEAGGESVGLDISMPIGQRRNSCINKAIGFHYFFTRKVMLSAVSQAYVFMPGGFGTFDELFEIVTLIQTKKMSSQVPVILVGAGFWHPLLQWLERMVLNHHGFITQDALEILQVVDSAEEAFAIIKKTKERML